MHGGDHPVLAGPARSARGLYFSAEWRQKPKLRQDEGARRREEVSLCGFVSEMGFRREKSLLLKSMEVRHLKISLRMWARTPHV